MLKSVVVSVAIDRPYAEVYAFLAEPRNFPSWAANLTGPMVQVNETDWSAQTREEPVMLRFTPPNPFGILDHAVFVEGADAVTIPMRVVENEGCAEVVYTLFQRPGADAADLASEAGWVTFDLNRLKARLEQGAQGDESAGRPAEP